MVPEQVGSTARDRIAAVPVWRHRIEVAEGVTTPGTEDNNEELNRLRIPADLAGQKVLDIGCSDGFYSFECERRGASVLAVDDESSLLAGGVHGFGIARDLLGSSVEYKSRDVHDLSPEIDGEFDLVLFINVLYHLKNPMLALERIASVTRPGGRLILKTYYRSDVRFWLRGRCISFDLDRRPKLWYFPSTELAGDPTNWHAPNRAAVEGLLTATGWTNIELVDRWRDRLYYHAIRAESS